SIGNSARRQRPLSQASPLHATEPAELVPRGCRLPRTWHCSCATTTTSAPNDFATGSAELLSARPPGSLLSTLVGRSRSSTTAAATKRLFRWFEVGGRTTCP